MEIWEKIEGYDNYEVSNLGRVRRFNKLFSTKKGIPYRILNLRKTSNGYYRAKLYKNSISEEVSMHRLVAKTFIPNPNNYPLVMHLDDNKLNNKVENLKWGTMSENIQDAWNKGLIKKRTIKQKI